MQENQRKDLFEKWQILGLSFMMMSKTPEDFHDLVKQEFGYIWDGKGWIKEVSYQLKVGAPEMNLLNIWSFLPLLTIWMTNW